MSTTDSDKGAVGAYIRQQREMAQLSLRELSRMSEVSNAYLSQIERGLHEPSLRVMKAVAQALSMPLEELLARSAGSDESEAAPKPKADVEAAIRAEVRLSPAQQEALIAVFRSYLAVSAAINPRGRRS
ncbi:MAG: helix-turn-helix domain-containing protein [Actinomycetales bacterium]